jgi:hypothetical protein
MKENDGFPPFLQIGTACAELRAIRQCAGFEGQHRIRKTNMTNYLNTLNSTVVAALLTVVFSAAMVAGAVAPAVDGSKVSQTVASALDNVPSKSAHSLA